jgi:vitamin B12 transporter
VLRPASILPCRKTLLLLKLSVLSIVFFFPPSGRIALAAPDVSAEDTSQTARGHARVYALEEVSVTGNRLPQALQDAPSPANVLTRAAIEAAGGISLGQVLAIQPGLFVKDYGAGGALKTISQRGMGTEHTLMLLNGIPINSVQTGILDLGTLVAGEIDRVEVVQGGHSASFGANAVAGVINIIPRQPEDGHLVRMRTGIGSFGSRELAVSLGSVTESALWRTSLSHDWGEGNYPFIYRNGPTEIPLERKNADFSSYAGNVLARGMLSGSTSAFGYVSMQGGERGVPGPVAGPVSQSSARQTDRFFIAQTGLDHIAGEQTAFHGDVQVQHAYQQYTDPDLVVNFVPLENSYSNTEIRGDLRTDIRRGKRTRVSAGADLAHASADANTLQEPVSRTHWGVYAVGEQRWEVGPEGSTLGVYPAIRFDRLGSGLSAFSPQVGMQWSVPLGSPSVLQELAASLRGSVSRNFREPTFNELYYSGGGGKGNPSLEPERSTGAELGAGLSFVLGGEHHLNAALFGNDMANRIVWVAAGAGAVSPKNLRRVLCRGLEWTYQWSHPAAGLSLSAHYTLTRSEKVSEDYPGDPNTGTQLPYLPEEQAGIVAGYSGLFSGGLLRAVDFSAGYGFVGYRYVTEDNTSILPSFATLRCGCAVTLADGRVDVTLRLDVQNVLNEAYEVMPGYPMPPRSFRGVLAVDY